MKAFWLYLKVLRLGIGSEGLLPNISDKAMTTHMSTSLPGMRGA